MAATIQPHMKKGRRVKGRKLVPLSIDKETLFQTEVGSLTSCKAEILRLNMYHYKWNPKGTKYNTDYLKSLAN